jgi:formylglycine-generating enzyme required for sulfatase activity
VVYDKDKLLKRQGLWGNDFVMDNIVTHISWEGGPALVESKPGGVSWIGANDLSGNIMEWVNDKYVADYYGTLLEDVVNPQGPVNGIYHVLRGGSWGSGSNFFRASARLEGTSDIGPDAIGFRCARSYDS